MGEVMRSAYKRLFEVRILHHYWLNRPPKTFDDELPADQERQLLLFDIRTRLNVAPTKSTEINIHRLQCVFKMTPIGFVVVVPENVEIPDDSLFEFVLTILDPTFFEYTALTLLPRKIFEFPDPVQNKVHRFKQNVPLLSNLTGKSRGQLLLKKLFLSKEYPAIASDDQVEALITDGTVLEQLTSDQPNALKLQLNATLSNASIFVHQDDSPDIIAPAGISILPLKKGILLNEEIPDSVFALIRIAAKHPTDVDYSCTINRLPKPVAPVFQVHFKNRSSIRRYFNKQTGAIQTTEANPTPMTFHGNTGGGQKPFNGLVKKLRLVDPNDTTEPKRLVSEIHT